MDSKPSEDQGGHHCEKGEPTMGEEVSMDGQPLADQDGQRCNKEPLDRTRGQAADGEDKKKGRPSAPFLSKTNFINVR